MSGPGIKSVLAEIGLRPSRKLGQNFLADGNLLRAIVRTAAPKPGERVLEIGPGTGVLTRALIAAGCTVTAIELDRRLYAYLQDTFGAEPGLRLVQGDACRLDIDELMGGEAYRCIANLPYAGSSVFLANTVSFRQPPTEMLVLLQREMSARLTAAPGSKDYGALTVKLRLVYEHIDCLRIVAPDVFYPPPEVESALVRLRRAGTARPPALIKAAAQIARDGFAQRRKRMLPLLYRTFGRERVQAAAAALGIPPDSRAEQLELKDFVALAARLQPDCPRDPAEGRVKTA